MMEFLSFAGVLVAKKVIFENPIPDGGGGGTVFFVTKDSHRYLQVCGWLIVIKSSRR